MRDTDLLDRCENCEKPIYLFTSVSGNVWWMHFSPFGDYGECSDGRLLRATPIAELPQARLI